jgi:hypothetical protein
LAITPGRGNDDNYERQIESSLDPILFVLMLSKAGHVQISFESQ